MNKYTKYPKLRSVDSLLSVINYTLQLFTLIAVHSVWKISNMGKNLQY